MAVRPRFDVPKRAQEASIQQINLPAPDGGVDAKSPLPSMQGMNSVYSYNLTVEEGAVKTRPGYRQWSLNLETSSVTHVGTLIPFIGTTNKLFAVTNEGIWDVSSYNTTPTHDLSGWSDTSANAGYGVWTSFTADNGDQYIFYADSVNGIYQYNVTTPTSPNKWVRPSWLLGGVDITSNVNFVVVHKQRIWFAQKDSQTAGYLGIGAVSGAATAFYFGSKFKHGGDLVGLFNWTVDGGGGVDDYLVSVSEGGDLIPYRGEDPSSADSWSQVGSYYIGKPPKGGTFASEYAGELYFLSAFGILAMSDILKGVDLGDSNRNPRSLSFKIARLLRDDISSRGNLYGWQMTFVPSRGDLIVNTPTGGVTYALQYVLNLAMGAWSFWREVPMEAVTEWNDNLYMAGYLTNTVNVYAMDVNRDNQLITAPASGLNGDAIDFSILSSFSPLNSPAQYKMAQYVRTDFLTDQASTPHQTKVLYDYDVKELSRVNASPEDTTLTTSVWDTSNWDQALWGGGQYLPYTTSVTGSSDIGRTIAIALRGTADGKTTLLGWDLAWKTARYSL